MTAGVGIEVRSLLISIAFVLGCLLVAELVNSVVDEPYLDEIFHVPQAQKYCKGKFDSYDPKLTTPPGLYLISLGFAIAVRYASVILPFTAGEYGVKSCETTSQLRYTCLLALLSLPWLLSSYKHQSRSSFRISSDVELRNIIKPTSVMEAMTIASANPSKSAQMARKSVAIRREQVLARRKRVFWGVIGGTLDSLHLTTEVHIISLLPPLWFFGFLYYTDIPSTVTVIAMLSCSKRDMNVVAALLGCASLTLRQTNIMWILFAIGTSLLRQLSSLGLANQSLSKSSPIEQLKSIIRLPLGPLITTMIRVLLPYTPVAILSGAFLVRNGRIVLGDKEHHQAALHWAQPLYCVTMLTIFAWPALFSSLKDASRLHRHFLPIPSLIFLTLLSLMAIHYGTIAHPFLLADNRHFTFYIWRKIINRTPWTRYALAPFYAIMLRIWWFALAQEKSLFWLLGFVLCTCAAIVPSPLIEPRYFLIPYLIARLNLFPDSKEIDLATDSDHPENRQIQQDRRLTMAALVIEGSWYIIINAATLYLFLYRPFNWPDSVRWQRFMW